MPAPSAPQIPYHQQTLPHLSTLLPKPSPRFYFDDLNTTLQCADPSEWSSERCYHHVPEGYWVFLPSDFCVVDHFREDGGSGEGNEGGVDGAEEVMRAVEEGVAMLDVGGCEQEGEEGAEQAREVGSDESSAESTAISSPAVTTPEQDEEGMQLVKVTERGPGSFTAVGTHGLIFCVGLYVELPSAAHPEVPNYFCWHIFGGPAGFQTLRHDHPLSPIYVLIKRTYHKQLNHMLGPLPSSSLPTLLIAYWHLAFGASAIIDGILLWAGVKDTPENLKEAWNEYCVRCKGFIVKEPGHGKGRYGVVFFVPDSDAEDDRMSIPGVSVWQGRRHGVLSTAGFDGEERDGEDDADEVEGGDKRRRRSRSLEGVPVR